MTWYFVIYKNTRIHEVKVIQHYHHSCGVRLSIFFFFQAEDGIRDYKVTGVQTCALPIWRSELLKAGIRGKGGQKIEFVRVEPLSGTRWLHAEAETKIADKSTLAPDKIDRKSTRLNSSHLVISYAVFCLKKKLRQQEGQTT